MVGKGLISQLAVSFSKEPKIELAYVLGSVVSGRAKSESDFDLAVVVEDKYRIDFNDVYSLISPISFPKDLDLSVVDKNSSPLFLFQMISTGEGIYQKSQKEKISFEANVLRNYYDNAHLRNIYYSYLKDKFPYASK